MAPLGTATTSSETERITVETNQRGALQTASMELKLGVVVAGLRAVATTFIARARGSQACIDIRDSGSPIAEQHLDTIFEEYTSYAGGQDRSGGGLGLAICRVIATAHDGCIWVENTPEGPRFSLVLPDTSDRSLRFEENSIESYDYTRA